MVFCISFLSWIDYNGHPGVAYRQIDIICKAMKATKSQFYSFGLTCDKSNSFLVSARQIIRTCLTI